MFQFIVYFYTVMLMMYVSSRLFLTLFLKCYIDIVLQIVPVF